MKELVATNQKLTRPVTEQEEQLALIHEVILERVQEAWAFAGRVMNGYKLTDQRWDAVKEIMKHTPRMDNTPSGVVHLHMSVPRPKTQEAEVIVPEESK